MIRPKSVAEVKKYLCAPLSHDSVVLYQRKFIVANQEIIFMLNPFGGASCNTQEVGLRDDLKITKDMLKDIIIIEQKDFGVK